MHVSGNAADACAAGRFAHPTSEFIESDFGNFCREQVHDAMDVRLAVEDRAIERSLQDIHAA